MTLDQEARMEDEIVEFYRSLEPEGPQERVRFSGCYYKANGSRWRRCWWAVGYLYGPLGRLPL